MMVNCLKITLNLDEMKCTMNAAPSHCQHADAYAYTYNNTANMLLIMGTDFCIYNGIWKGKYYCYSLDL